MSVVRIRESPYYRVFFKENIWEFGTLQTVRNREVSVRRGSTVSCSRTPIMKGINFSIGDKAQQYFMIF